MFCVSHSRFTRRHTPRGVCLTGCVCMWQVGKRWGWRRRVGSGLVSHMCLEQPLRRGWEQALDTQAASAPVASSEAGDCPASPQSTCAALSRGSVEECCWCSGTSRDCSCHASWSRGTHEWWLRGPLWAWVSVTPSQARQRGHVCSYCQNDAVPSAAKAAR